MTHGLSDREWLERKSVKIWKQDPFDPRNYLGTGCLITRRHIVTAAHVVSNIGQDRLVVTGRAWASERTVRQGPEYPERTAPRAPRRDFAVLGLAETDQTDEEPLPLADEAFLRETQYESVTIGGFAQPSGEGLKTRVLDIENYDDTTDSLIAAGASESGMSGGPVVRKGMLVGVVYATNEQKHKTYIVPLIAVRPFLEKYISTEKLVQNRTETAKLRIGEARKWALYIDRHDQVANLAGFLDSYRSPDASINSLLSYADDAPIVALLPSTPQDRHRYLRHRFEQGESSFNPESEYASSLAGIRTYDIQFPVDESKDTGEMFLRMKERLRSSLSAKSISSDDIREALNAQHSPQAVFTTITSRLGTIGPKREQLVENWIKFWESVAGGQKPGAFCLNHPIIIILSVVIDDKEKNSADRTRPFFARLFNRRRQGRPIKEWIDECSRRQGRVRFGKFAELDLVYQADVEAWLLTLKKRFGALRDAVDEAITNVPAVVPDTGASMAHFVDNCLDKLSIIDEKEKGV